MDQLTNMVNSTHYLHLIKSLCYDIFDANDCKRAIKKRIRIVSTTTDKELDRIPDKEMNQWTDVVNSTRTASVLSKSGRVQYLQQQIKKWNRRRIRLSRLRILNQSIIYTSIMIF